MFDDYMRQELIKSDADIVGKLAFAHYLIDKLTFIENYKKKNSDNIPGKEEMGIFEISVIDDTDRFQNSAAQEIATFMTAAISKKRIKWWF